MMSALAEKVRRALAVFEKSIKSEGFGFTLLVLGIGIMISPLGALGAYLEAEDKLSFDWNALVVPLALIMLFGVALFALGFLIVSPQETIKTGNVQSYLDEHQRALTIALRKPRCSFCGNEVPEGNFEVCPFCGNSLKA